MPVADGAGGSTDAAPVIEPAWPAAIDPAPPAWRLTQIIGGAISEREHIIGMCRYLEGLTVGCTLVWRGRSWMVRGVRDPYARGRWLELAAEALT